MGGKPNCYQLFLLSLISYYQSFHRSQNSLCIHHCHGFLHLFVIFDQLIFDSFGFCEGMGFFLTKLRLKRFVLRSACGAPYCGLCPLLLLQAQGRRLRPSVCSR